MILTDLDSKKRAGLVALVTFAVQILCLANAARSSYFATCLACAFALYECLQPRTFNRKSQAVLYAIWVVLICVALMTVDMESWNGSGFNMPPDGWNKRMVRAILNFVIVSVFFVFFISLTGRIKRGCKISIVLLTIMAVANAVVYQFKGTLLLPIDLLAVATAMDVAEGYQISVNANMIISITFLMSAWAAANSLPEWNLMIRPKKKRRQWLRVTGIALSCLMVFLFFALDTETFYYSWWKEHNGYPYNIMMNLKMLRVDKPKGYDEEEIASIIAQGGDSVILQDYSAEDAIKEAFPEYYAKYGAKPIIIGVMNESFSDLNDVGELKTDKELISNIRSLSDEMITGNLYTEVYGGGTCDSEYTFLTGNSTILFAENARAYQLYIKDDNSSIAKSLQNQGYETYYMHPETAKNWNRSTIYPLIGFDYFISAGDDKEDPNENDFYGAEIIRDSYVSDRATYEYIEQMYESIDEPFFCFDVTMQNHGNFLQSYYNLDPVTITNMSGTYPMAEQYLSLVRLSDEEFGELVDYFEDADRPVIIVMFGDHQPKLDEGFYAELSGTDLNDWSPEQSQNQQITPFMIWANYDLPDVTYDEMSINYLSTLLIECSGTEMTPYQHYLAWLYEQYPVINKKGVITADGKYIGYTDLNDQEKTDITQYEYVLYNNITDTKNRDASLYIVE